MSDPASIQSGAELLKGQIVFVYDFFMAAEIEARTTERYLLGALGAIYSYLATQKVPPRYLRLAWYTSALVTIFAAVRALGLGLRQRELLDFIAGMQAKSQLPDGVPGRAARFKDEPPYVFVTAACFYGFLIAATVWIAWRMTPGRTHEVTLEKTG